MKEKVLRTSLDVGSYRTVTAQVIAWAQAASSRYICAANVHMLMEAWDSALFREVVNSADMVTPDGMPLVWMLRQRGVKGQQRVYGPTLMLHVLEAAEREGAPVGFYGGDAETLEMLLERLQAQYPRLIVGFSLSPPFRALSPAEDEAILREIQQSEIRILFVALGCPKQEIWMAERRGRIPAVMLGVGAAFDFHAGTVMQAPAWMQKMGLEWLFRLTREPQRLWKRYLFHNPRFIILALWELIRSDHA